MEKAIEIIKEMIMELEVNCPNTYSVDNDYVEIQNKIEVLNEAIQKIKKEI